MRNHLTVARESVWLQIGGVLLFVAAVAMISNAVQPRLSGNALIGTGIVLALVPAALWLWMFYREDRFEPEPRQFVIGIFMLGALLSYAVGQPLIRTVFRIQDWTGTSLVTALLGSILVGGFIQQFLLYAAVRYTVFSSSEFDQRIDGIIYGAAAGLGYATMANIQYVVDSGGVQLGVGAMEIAIEALSLASLGGVTGYFLARAKFDKMGPLWLPIGMIIAAALNGVVDLTLAQAPLAGEGFGYHAWYGLTAAVIIAGATFAVLFRLLQRENAAGAATAKSEPSSLDRVLVGKGKSEEPEWVVWLVVAIGLLAGGLFGTYVLGQTKTTASGKNSVTFPASWSLTTEPGAILSVYDLEGGGVFGTRVSVRVKPKAALYPEEGSLYDAAANWAVDREKELSGFRLLGIEPTRIQGRDAASIEYAYLLDSPASASGMMPALMHAVDTITISGDQIYGLSFAAESHAYDRVRSLSDQIIATWQVP